MLALGMIVSLGCRHVGGKCDQCAATPGDASLYAPLTTYTSPTMPTPVPAYVEPKEMPKKEVPMKEEGKKAPNPMTEELGKPKELKK
jgi:hypothetical protein